MSLMKESFYTVKKMFEINYTVVKLNYKTKYFKHSKLWAYATLDVFSFF